MVNGFLLDGNSREEGSSLMNPVWVNIGMSAFVVKGLKWLPFGCFLRVRVHFVGGVS